MRRTGEKAGFLIVFSPYIGTLKSLQDSSIESDSLGRLGSGVFGRKLLHKFIRQHK